MSEPRLTAQQKQAVAQCARGFCEYCQSPARFSSDTFSIEHITPRSRGGTEALSKVQLRPLEANDISDVVALWYRAWHHTFPDLHHPDALSTWERRFRDDLACRGTVWVAEGREGIVGFIVVLIQENYLDQIFVDPTHQQQGIGTLLLEKAKELCPQRLTLHTLQRNAQAGKFYERHGFTAGHRGINKINGLPNVEYGWQP